MGVNCNNCKKCQQVDLSQYTNIQNLSKNSGILKTNNNEDDDESNIHKNNTLGFLKKLKDRNSFADKFLNSKTKSVILPVKKTNNNLIKKFSTHLLKFKNEKSQLEIIANFQKSEKDIKLIRKALSNYFFINTLSEKYIEEIINEIHFAKIKANKIIYMQGYESQFLYILKNGIVELLIDDILIKKLTNGESFGELALLNSKPRLETIRTLIQCELYILERDSFRKIIDKSMKENYTENKNFIKSISVFKIMDSYQQTLLCNSLYEEIFLENQMIAKEGDEANCIYIIKEGEVICVKNSLIIRTLYKGENFGERSIFGNSKRTLDVIAKTNCVCYSISFKTLENILGKNYKRELCKQFIKFTFSKSNFFNFVDMEYLNRTFPIFDLKNYSKNEVIIKQGNIISKNIYVLIDGNVVNEDNNDIISKRGEILLEENLFLKGNLKAKYNLIAYPDSLICIADTEMFLEHLNVKNFEELKINCYRFSILQKNYFLRKLPIEKIADLIEKMKVKTFDENEKITNKNEKGDKIYFIISGKVNVEKVETDENNNIINYSVIEFGEGECIGQNLLYEDQYSISTFAKTNCQLLFIFNNLFRYSLGPTLTSYLKDSLTLVDKSIELKDLEFLFDINSNIIRTVSLVISKTNGKKYVIKSYPKNSIIMNKTFKKIKLYKTILTTIDHPLIVKYIKHLEDSNNIFLLFEFISGIILDVFIKEINHKHFSIKQTQFYFATILIIINYLHKKNIVHRDITPENFIINENGYLCLYDLRCSIIIKDKTNSIIEKDFFYMSPEVILGDGYSFEIDYWSAAVIMYELVIGHLPFSGNKEDPMSIYFSIINEKLNFPLNFENKAFENLISRMLEKNFSKRLAKIELIQSHQFFFQFKFSDVEYLTFVPQYFPKILNIKNITEGSYKKHSILKYNEIIHENPNMILTDAQRAIHEPWFKNF